MVLLGILQKRKGYKQVIETEKHNPERLLSLDALRGFDMMFLMGMGGMLYELSALMCGTHDGWLGLQMKHVAWEGFRHHDTIFPLFIFLAGVSFPFSCAAATARGVMRGGLVLKATKRLMLLFLLGLVYNGVFALDFGNIRYASVLARIGCAWYGAALLHLFVKELKIRFLIAAVMLAGYWAICFFMVAPDAPAGAGAFSEEGCFAGYVDRLFLPGRFAGKHLDPEGIISVFPSISLAMSGMFTGELVSSKRFSGNRKTLMLLASSATMLLVTLLWMPWCPIIKKIWTPTFITASVAYSLALFAVFYWIVDVMKFRLWTFPLRVIGMNAITVYLLYKIVSISDTAKFFFGGVISFFPVAFSPLLLNAAILSTGWLILLFLYRKGIFLRV